MVHALKLFRRLFVFCFIAVGLIWWGSQEIATARHNRKVTTLSMNDFASGRRDAKWLELSNCVLGIESAMHKDTGDDKVWQLYVPVYGTNDDDGSKTRLLLITQDSELKKLYEALTKVDDVAKARAMLIANRDRLWNRTLQGVVREGDEKELEQLAKLDSTLAPGFALLQDGDKPSMKLGVILLLAGLLIAGAVAAWIGFGLRSWYRQKKPQVAAAAPRS